MSLINEALKRAEAENRQHDGGDAPVARRPKPRAAAALAVVVIATVCGFTYLSVPPQARPKPSPRPQVAQAAAARGTAALRMPGLPPVEELPRAQLAAASPTSRPSPPATPEAPTTRPTSRPAEEIAATSRPAFDASQFQLGAILKSGDGAHAVINGHMVTVGDEVSGARVVVIGPYHVVLEKAGERLSLRM